MAGRLVYRGYVGHADRMALAEEVIPHSSWEFPMLWIITSNTPLEISAEKCGVGAGESRGNQPIR